MKAMTGSVATRGTFAYVAQQVYLLVETIENLILILSLEAWIQSCSVRENILFGTLFDEQKYSKVCN